MPKEVNCDLWRKCTVCEGNYFDGSLLQWLSHLTYFA